MRHFLECGVFRQVGDRVAAVVQSGAFLLDGADGRFAGHHAGQAAALLLTLLAHSGSSFLLGQSSACDMLRVQRPEVPNKKRQASEF